MRVYVVVIGIFILTLSLVHADVSLQIEEVKVNDGLTHEVSNDTNYFSPGLGQNATIEVRISNEGGSTSVNAIVGMWLVNETGDKLNPGGVFQNRTVVVPANGENTTTFIYVINSTTSLPTGRYNITVFVEYPKNATYNETIYDTSEYLNLVRLQAGSFVMEHSDKDATKGDWVRFLQTIINPGSINATATVIVDVIYDSDGDGVFEISEENVHTSERSFVVESGKNVTEVFIWIPTQDGKDYSNASRWLVRSWFNYGYATLANEIKYIYNLTLEYLILKNEGVTGTTEYAPGDTIISVVDVNNSGLYNATLHEAKAWIEDENGNKIVDMVAISPPYNPNETYTPGYQKQLQFQQNLPSNLTPGSTYKVVMAIDHGVPRTLYIKTDIYPYGGFNDYGNATFEIVKGNVTNLYFREEVAYNVNPNFKIEIENLGPNSIDEGKCVLKIYNNSFGYEWNTTEPLVISGGAKINYTPLNTWIPTSSTTTPPGSYAVEGEYKFGVSGSSLIKSTIKIVSFGVKSVDTIAVAPYESTIINITVENQGPTNATLNLIETGIGTTPFTEVGNYSNVVLTPYENHSFIFNYYFDPTNLTNGSYPVEVNLTYGGKLFNIAPMQNITLLPVGIKSYSIPSVGVNGTPFDVTAIFKNIGNSNVSVFLNITANGTTCNSTLINVLADNETTATLSCNLTAVGTYNITLYANYSGLVNIIQRSGSITLYDSPAELAINSSDITVSPSSPTTGQTVTISATVHNLGMIDAQNFIVALLIDGSAVSNTTLSVNANSSNTTTFTWTATQGSHTIEIVVDYTNLITGENESNNNASVSITVTSPTTTFVGGAGGGEAPSAKVTVIEAPSYISEYAMEGELTQTEVIELIKDARLAYADRYYIEDKVLAGVLAPNDVLPVGDDLRYEFPTTKSLEGDVYEAAAKYFNENTFGARIIVIARGDLEADCLAAARFAKLMGAKVLLTKPGELPYPTLKILSRVHPTKVYIIGGEKAVSKEVEDRINLYAYEVKRIGGKDRYETSLLLAKEGEKAIKTEFAIVTSGRDVNIYACALAAKLNVPLLLYDGQKEVEEYLKKFKYVLWI